MSSPSYVASAVLHVLSDLANVIHKVLTHLTACHVN